MEITTTQLIAGTYTAVGVMLIVALYHMILIFVDLRKIVKRFTNVSEHMETVVIRPLAFIEKGIEWVTAYLEHSRKSTKSDENEDEEDEDMAKHNKKHAGHDHHAAHHESHSHKKSQDE